MKTEIKHKIKINGKILNDNVYIAETFFERLKGLMFTPFSKRRILLIKNCNSVHTFFMNFSLDIVCLDEDFKTVKIFCGVKPFRFIFPSKRVKHILEIPSYKMQSGIGVNDIIEIK